MTLLEVFAAGYLIAVLLAWLWLRGATKDQDDDDDEQWDW